MWSLIKNDAAKVMINTTSQDVCLVCFSLFSFSYFNNSNYFCFVCKKI